MSMISIVSGDYMCNALEPSNLIAHNRVETLISVVWEGSTLLHKAEYTLTTFSICVYVLQLFVYHACEHK